MKSEKETIYNELLILRCKRGEKDALEELIRLWEKRLFYYIRKLENDEQNSWDILQETWLKVIREIKSLREPRSLPVWLYRIARNTTMSHLRVLHSTITLFEESEYHSSIEKNTEHLHFENAEQVHYGLSQISLLHREILTLYFLQDFILEEIADVLEAPLGTVKSRLHYAKLSLRAVLEKENQNNG